MQLKLVLSTSIQFYELVTLSKLSIEILGLINSIFIILEHVLGNKDVSKLLFPLVFNVPWIIPSIENVTEVKSMCEL